jgi:transmembrane sensor
MSTRKQMAEAAQWFMELDRPGADPRRFMEWQQWMRADAAHQTAYTAFERQMHLKFKQGRLLPTAEEMAADDYDGSVPIEDWKLLPRTAQRSSLVRYAIAAGIAALTLAGGGSWLYGDYRAQHGTFSYHTAAGERREFKLAEGSRVTLDADSELEVELTPERRTLHLTHGEAYFDVAKHARRPFTVRAGNAEVLAVGTAFDVRMSEDRTVVAVTEGKVEVTSGAVPVTSPSTTDMAANGKVAKPAVDKHAAPIVLAAQVSAGEAVSYVTHAGLSELPPAEASLATTWLKGRRQYRNEPLRYVLADIDRYTGKQIAIANTATGDLQFTGTLDLDNSDAWLKGLAVALPVTIGASQDGQVFIAARE